MKYKTPHTISKKDLVFKFLLFCLKQLFEIHGFIIDVIFTFSSFSHEVTALHTWFSFPVNSMTTPLLQGPAEGLLECGWQGNNKGVIIYGFNLNISPNMSCGVLECDVMFQNYMLMIL